MKDIDVFKQPEEKAMEGDPPTLNITTAKLPAVIDQNSLNKWIDTNVICELDILNKPEASVDYFGDMNGSTKLMDCLCQGKKMSFTMEFVPEDVAYRANFSGFIRQHKFPSVAICLAGLASYGFDINMA